MSKIDTQNLAHNLYDFHDFYREKTLAKRRFGYQKLLALVERLAKNDRFKVSVATQSTEGRNIHLVKIGTGDTKVMLWSQMHGDEATATMALFDIFNFFDNQTQLLKAMPTAVMEQFEELRELLLEKCTFYFVPMLNPDGAEAWSRYTATGIDMNRDALALQTPEGQLLKKLIVELKPDFGFNLHDQGRRYAAGETPNLATISFLATAYNAAQEINDTRERAIKMIVGMNKPLQAFIPNGVGKWPADFEPRAFGDNIQQWGTTLILVESGGYPNDPEKQYIRKLNFVALLFGMQMIATKTYQQEAVEAYELIPVNSRVIYDLIVRNVTLHYGEHSVMVDLAINRNEKPVAGKSYFINSSIIEEIGDMSVFFGTDEIEASGLTIEAKKPIRLGSKADFNLVKNGEIVFSIKNGVKL